MDMLVGSVCSAFGVAVGLLVLLALLRQFLIICRPNEMLILSGRQHTMADGMERGYRVIHGGLAFRIPVLEKIDVMELGTLPLDLHVANAYSKGGIPLNLHAIANVKISSDARVMMNAAERFLGRDLQEIRRVAKESLEAHLRGVLSRLTPEEVNEDRLKFANALVDEADDDLHKLGLQLDTLKVLNVHDDVKYLDSIGRERIANVIMVADMAESKAKNEAEQAEAGAHRTAQIAVENAEASIIQKQNELRKVKAELEAEAKAEEERTVQIAAQARAEAEQELQQIRQKLETTRLMVEMVLPARAQQQAEALSARGEASAIAENGKAAADVLEMLAETWVVAGDDARDIFVMQQLEELMSAVALPISAVQIGEVSLVDKGDGKALANYLAGFPAAVNSVFDEIQKTTGVDVRGAMAPREVK